jgi:hypothetical protein
VKYLLATVSLVLGLVFAGPPLWYTHTLPVVPAGGAFVCIAFAFYLFDPTSFLEFSAEARKNATAWLTRKVEP